MSCDRSIDVCTIFDVCKIFFTFIVVNSSSNCCVFCTQELYFYLRMSVSVFEVNRITVGFYLTITFLMETVGIIG